MSILGIQLLGILFALLMFYITFLHQRRKEFTIKEYLFWSGAWIIFLLLSLFPTSLDFFIKNVLSLSRRLDFFIIIGFMFITGILFHTYTIVRKTQNKTERIVRAMTFKQMEKNEQEKDKQNQE